MKTIEPSEAQGKTKELFQVIEKKLGKVPNMLKALGNSSAALEAYLSLSGALGQGQLDAKTRESIALSVGKANSCDYCVAAHSFLGAKAGLSKDEIADNLKSTSKDPKTAAMLSFANSVVTNRGNLSGAEIDAVKKAGVTDGEIAEIVANVALNIYTNYFNHISKTEIDF